MNTLLNKIEESFNNAVFPNKKIEFWRFADFKSFSENNISKYLNGSSANNAKAIPFFSFSDFKDEDFAKISIKDDCQYEVVCDQEGVKVENVDFSEEFYSILNGKISLLAAKNIKKICKISVSSKDVLINLEANSSFSPYAILIDISEGSNSRIYIQNLLKENSFADILILCKLGKNANAFVSQLNRTTQNCLMYSRACYRLDANAKLQYYNVQEGNSPSRCEVSFDSIDKNTDVLGKAFIKNNSDCQHDFRSVQNHIIGECKSRVELKNVLDNNAKAAFMGFVYIGKKGDQSSAMQSCKTLLLSKDAKVQASPVLEIEANDVECSHGCAVSMPNEDEVFYLNSRGLSDKEAKALIAEGFANYAQALPL